jgi:subtilisin family serine protease
MSRVISQDLQASGVAQVIVVLKQAPAAAALGGRAAVGGPMMAAPVGGLERHFRHSELSQDSALAASTLTPPNAVEPALRYYPNLGVALGTVDREGLAALRSDPAVASVQGAPKLSLIAPERIADAKLSVDRTWGLRVLKAPELWAKGYTGGGILVGHLDTGVDGRHPALRGAIESFAEFDALGFEVTPTPAARDSGEHGTHTAATIAGRPVQSRHVGMAPDAKLASALVIEGGNTVARVLGGMDWAVGQRVRILSMSLGFRGWWEDFIPIARILRRQRVLPVFAVGNEGPGTSRSPGNYPQALSVGAMGRDRTVVGFSSSQRFQRRRDPLVPDLIGPGVAVTSAKPGGGWQDMDGTSMATPHIAGLAALLMQAAPNAPLGRIERAIFDSCTLEPTMRRNRANRGLPNGLTALALLKP